MIDKELVEKLDQIFDGCYSKDASTCPLHTIFQRGKAQNLIMEEFVPLVRRAERERITAWGLEICPHWAGKPTREVGVMKRDCSQCWQALGEK